MIEIGLFWTGTKHLVQSDMMKFCSHFQWTIWQNCGIGYYGDSKSDPISSHLLAWIDECEKERLGTEQVIINMADGVCVCVCRGDDVHTAQPMSSFSMDGKTYRLGESAQRLKNDKRTEMPVHLFNTCERSMPCTHIHRAGESAAKCTIFGCCIFASLAGHQLRTLSFASFISKRSSQSKRSR